MKLLDRSSKHYFQYSFVLLAFIGFILFIISVLIANQEIDEDLLEAKTNFEEQIEYFPPGNFELLLNHEKIHIEQVESLSDVQQFRDTSFSDLIDGEFDQFRTLVFYQTIHNHPCRITIAKSQIEKTELFLRGGTVFLLAAAFLFFGLNYLNRKRSKKLWMPFYQILDQLDKFSLNRPQRIIAEETQTEEFDLLASTIEKMTGKMRSDIEALKSFSANASHEMQTPLAMIRNKIDMLMQSDHLRENELNTLREVSLSTHRLSKLTESLLTLTRIENQKFDHNAWLSVDDHLLDKMQDFEPVLEAKEIQLLKDINPCKLNIAQESLDMMLNNVLSNAVKHNVQNGLLHIKLDQGGILIKNSGPKPNKSTDVLMDRFQKGVDDPQSFGLGLSIVGGICKAYGFNFSYKYQNELHITQIAFHSD